MRITVSGLIGCGKSTLSKSLCRHFSLSYFSTGDIFREMARSSGMTLEEFSSYAESRPEIDRGIDQRSISFMRENDNIVADSRLSGWLSYRHDIPAIRIWLSADLDVRVKRVAGREGGTLEEVRERIIERENSEIKRYMDFYSIDLLSMKPYHIVMNTNDLDAQQVFSGIIKKMEEGIPWTDS